MQRRMGLLLKTFKNGFTYITKKHYFKQNNQYNTFSFISDCEKGIIDGLEIYFPNSHHLSCAYHIMRNVYAKYSKIGNKEINQISKIFSQVKENKYFNQLDAVSHNATEYVLGIPPNKWRSTTWLNENKYLPPRYGMVTLNNSEFVICCLIVLDMVFG